MRYLNQLEPDGLIDNFINHPPVDFKAWLTDNHVPVFSAKFDLLTTADLDFQQKLKKVPLFNYWRKLLQPYTCFVGTTVSEYALLTADVKAGELACQLKQAYATKYPFLIVKDIPQDSPLQSQLTNDYSRQFIQALQQAGFVEVEGQALAWVPIDFATIDEYLARLSASRRKDFRRKLKSRENLDIQIIHSGDDCFFDSSIIDLYYQLYLNVYGQSEIHFDLLTKSFFTHLLQDKQTKATIITYYHQKELIGYNICFIINEILIDKYIGFTYPAARDLNLYFVSWFYNLEYARLQGLKYYVAGWTDPEVKASLGAKFTFTKHMVYIRNPILRSILRRLSSKFESDRSWRDSCNDAENNKRVGS